MTVRFYSSIAQETTLVGSITNANLTITVASVVGFPSSTPYTLAIDYATATEELVTVTNTSGTLLTVTRGSDGTSATSHTSGAKVRHVSSARDFADSRSHENATTDIHGVPPGASIVSTTGTQTLTNKTFSGGVISGAAITGGSLAGAITSSATITTGTYSLPTINNGIFNNITTGPWTAYSPTWKTTTGAVTLGNGNVSGKYSKVGRMVTLEITALRGGTTTFDNNASIWQFSLPFTANQTANTVSSGTAAFEALFGVGLGISWIRQLTSSNHVSVTSMPGANPWTANEVAAGLPMTINITYDSTT
jgi:hypothetical protein